MVDLRKHKQNIIEDYESGLTINDLEDIYPASASTIYLRLKKWGVKIWGGSKDIDHNMFTPLTREAKYWIGYIAGDGCINKKKNRISITSKDKEHLEKFKHFSGSGHKICSKVGNYSFSKGEIFSISILSRKSVKILGKYGITERKSNTLRIESEQLLLSSDFWRAIIDSDGHIHKNVGSIYIASGSIEFLNQAVVYIPRAFDIPQSKIWIVNSKNGRGEIYSRVYISAKQSREILKKLYKDSIVSLDRKRRRAEKFF